MCFRNSTFQNSDKNISKFIQIHFKIQTNIFQNLYKYVHTTVFAPFPRKSPLSHLLHWLSLDLPHHTLLTPQRLTTEEHIWTRGTQQKHSLSHLNVANTLKTSLLCVIWRMFPNASKLGHILTTLKSSWFWSVILDMNAFLYDCEEWPYRPSNTHDAATAITDQTSVQ